MSQLPLSTEQMNKCNKWESSHDCTITYGGAIDGRTTYSFTPTTLGLISKVSCACGKELDVTDYEDW